ncbi:MAG TPA: hypothetical protein VF543_07680 [Pyrinomonadaceae bacterium]|jgi:hypothetical protein
MKFILWIIFTISPLLICPTLVTAQSSGSPQKPSLQSSNTEISEDTSLEETLNWLKEQIRIQSFYKIKSAMMPNYLTYKVVSINFEGCTIIFKDVITETSPTGKVITTHNSEIKVNMADLDYMRVYLDMSAVQDSGNYTVHAFTLGNRSIIQHLYEFRSRRTSKRDNRPKAQMSFVFTNEDVARRVVKALAHAIKLCSTMGR